MNIGIWVIGTSTQIKFYTSYLKNVIHQTDSKNEWLLLSSKFMEKCGLASVLTLENAVFRGFILKQTERVYVLLTKSTRYFQNSPPFKRSACFCMTISRNFERFQYFNFKTDFLEIAFQKTGVPFLS